MDNLELDIAYRADGALVNVFTGMGVPGKDRSTATSIASRFLLTEAELELLYLVGIPRRFVDAIPEEIFRHLPTIKIGGDESSTTQKQITEFEESLKALKAHAAIAEAIQLQRLYGGSVIIPLIDDGTQDYTEPLDVKRIRAVEGFAALSRHEAVPHDFNILDYSKPTHYRISTSQKLTDDQTETTVDLTLHHSRVIRFDGIYLPWRMRSRNTGWGMSCLQLIWDAYKRYESSMSGLEDMIQDSDLFVHKMPGLFKRLAGGGGGEEAMRRRLEANVMARSNYGGMAIDTEEEVAFLSRALSNLAQATQPFVEELQAATGWPASILMGNSPGGLGKEGRFEERVWASIVEKWQEVYCREPITELFTLLLSAKTGAFKGRPPEKWEVHFPSVFTETDEEKAAKQAQFANVDSTYINAGVLDRLEVRNSRFGGNDFGTEIILDKKVSKMMKEQQQMQHDTTMVGMQAQQDAAMGMGGPAPGDPVVENGSQQPKGQPPESDPFATSPTENPSQQAQSPQANPQPNDAPENQSQEAEGEEGDVLTELQRLEENTPEPDTKNKRRNVLDSIDIQGIRILVTHEVDNAKAGYVVDWDGQRIDSSSLTYVVVGPNRTTHHKLYRSYFRSDSSLIPGPYVVGFSTTPLAARGVAKLYPKLSIAGLQEVPSSKLQALRSGWGAY